MLYLQYPPLPSARRFFKVARQFFFEMKTNKKPYFSILSSFNSVAISLFYKEWRERIALVALYKKNDGNKSLLLRLEWFALVALYKKNDGSKSLLLLFN